MNKIKQLSLIIALLFIGVSKINAQTVFYTTDSTQADLIVFVTNSQSQSDMDIFVVSSPKDINAPGEWYECSSAIEAELIVYKATKKQDASIIIYFVNDKTKVKIKDNSKKVLLKKKK